MTSTRERDDLAKVVRRADAEAEKDCPGIHYSNMAEVILAAGYHKEPQDRHLADLREVARNGDQVATQQLNEWHSLRIHFAGADETTSTSAPLGCCEDHTAAESVNEWSLHHAADGLVDLGASSTLSSEARDAINFARLHLLRAAEFVRGARSC